jgi:hypothetical protein
VAITGIAAARVADDAEQEAARGAARPAAEVQWSGDTNDDQYDWATVAGVGGGLSEEGAAVEDAQLAQVLAEGGGAISQHSRLLKHRRSL